MAHVPKYILAKAKRLNNRKGDSDKLAKEITNWLMLSGVPYAGIPPHNRLVEGLKLGDFPNEEAIKKGFDALMD